MSDRVDNTSELEKSMSEAMEELEFEIASEFQESDPEIQKSINFDLQQVVVEDDNFDTHAFLKSMGEVSQSNLGRLARAMESLLKVVSTQNDLIKGLSDKINGFGKAVVDPIVPRKAAITSDMAKSMVTERPFGNLIEGTSELTGNDGGLLVGPFKERLRKALLKGIEADTIDNESALTVLGMNDDTPLAYIVKVVKPEVKSLIESVIKVQ